MGIKASWISKFGFVQSCWLATLASVIGHLLGTLAMQRMIFNIHNYSLRKDYEFPHVLLLFSNERAQTRYQSQAEKRLSTYFMNFVGWLVDKTLERSRRRSSRCIVGPYQSVAALTAGHRILIVHLAAL